MVETRTQSTGEDPVFVCGALRSGTTLLRLMIDAHPQLSNPGEMDFLFEPPLDGDGVPDMARYAHELSFNRVFKKCGLKLAEGLSHAEQVRAFVEQLAVPGKKLSINIHRHFDRVPAIFPGAKFVHLLRDPRDVAKSSIGMGWAGNVYCGVDHWIDSEKSFETLETRIGADRVFTLKNEDLIRGPQESLARLCAFLGVAYDSRMLDYPAHTTYSLPDPKLVEQWRANQSDREIALVEGKLGSMLTARGYAPSGVAPVSPGAMARIGLRQGNRLGRLKFSADRYGLILTVAQILSRRLPFDAARSWVRRKVAEREAQFLK